MTAAAGPENAETGAKTGEAAWRAARSMSDIQYSPVPKVQVKPIDWPDWLEAIGRFFGKGLSALADFLGGLIGPLGRLLGQSWSAVEILLIALGVAGACWIAWMLLWPLWRDRKPKVAAPESWAPAREAALALLEDADRLAGEGRFGEAAHLLLQRSVHHIASARPDWLTPSSTAREIGAIGELPWKAKQAFAVIAREVERSLFAMRGLTAEDWAKARGAYAEFALADLKASA